MKNVIAFLLTFTLFVTGVAVLIYRQTKSETDNPTIEIMEKPEAQSEANTSAGHTGNKENIKKTGQQNLKTMLNVPDVYEINLQDDEKDFSVQGSAAVQVPNVTGIPTRLLTEKELTQEWIDKFNQTFFPGGSFYVPSTHYRYPYDPIGENGDFYKVEPSFDVLRDIRIKEEEEGQINNNDISADEMYGDRFSGFAKSAEGVNYHYSFDKRNLVAERFPREEVIKEHEEQEEYGYADFNWTWTPMEPGDAGKHSGILTEERLQELAEITVEDAIARADSYVEQLSLEGMSCQAWEYCIRDSYRYVGDASSTVMENTGAYLLHYSRRLDGVPITYTSEYGGMYDMAMESSFGSDQDSWGYERMDIIISKDGVEVVEVGNLYEMGEVLESSPPLLDFAQIRDIFEKSYFEQDFATDVLVRLVFHLTDVKLGYMRIYDPQHPDTGQLVPVWDFMGWQECTGALPTDGKYKETYEYTNENPYTSYMTINAIDGSIITRSYGY